MDPPPAPALSRWRLPGGHVLCAWREIVKDTQEYRREMPVIPWVLGLHRTLLQSRPEQP